MTTFLQATLVAAAAAAAAAIGATACASGGGGHRDACVAPPGDSVYQAGAPAYRSCAVTREARLVNTSLHPTFDPNARGGPTCYSAEYEFVVDPSGRAERGVVRLLKSNSTPFADAVAQMIPLLVYEPAMKDGAPVRQIVSFKQAAQVMKIVVPAGAPIPKPSARAPAC